MIGRVFGGKYRVDRLLGAGGMGAVYEATNTAIGRRVAVKTILHHKAAAPGAMDRFRREAFTMAKIESEHVASILDAGEDAESGVAYLVMEFLSGEDLDHTLKRLGSLPAQTAWRIASQALEGLRAAHLAGIAHRDIKPSNIFLTRRAGGAWVVKLVDFGIARSLAEDETPASKQLTKTGSIIGTPSYMSPEQLASSPTLDFRTDLWSLGVVVFQMFGGANPYEDSVDFPQLLARICFVPPPALRDKAPWCAAEDAEVVEGAMKRDPAERYANATVMLEAVKRRVEGPPALTDAMLVSVSAEERARHPAMAVATAEPARGVSSPGATVPFAGAPRRAAPPDAIRSTIGAASRSMGRSPPWSRCSWSSRWCASSKG